MSNIFLILCSREAFPYSSFMENEFSKQLNAWFSQYVDENRYVLRLRSETIRSSIEAFRHFNKIVPEVKYAAGITTELVTLFFQRLQTRERLVGSITKVGIKDSTVRTYGSRLKTFCTWLVNKQYIQSHPFAKIKLPNPEYTDRRALTNEDIKRLMGAVVQHSQNTFILKRDLVMIGIMTFCGLRRNELLSLQLADIDLAGGCITVRAETSKSKRMRKVPINLTLRLYIEEYLAERRKKQRKCEYFLTASNADTPLSHDGLRHWVKRLSRYSGVKFHVHRFRHTFATNLAKQDVGAVKIQKLMGHTDLKMTCKYLRSFTSEDLHEDINKLSFDNIE